MIYYNVYQEILQATDYFCKAHSIDMVMRFSGDPVDVQNPDSIGAFIHKEVVWYDCGLDITDYILQDVNRAAAAPERGRLAGRADAAGKSLQQSQVTEPRCRRRPGTAGHWAMIFSSICHG